jgi:hypothetical protein
LEIISNSVLLETAGLVGAVLETRIGPRDFYVSLGLGSVTEEDAMLSADASQCLDWLISHSERRSPDGAVRLVAVDRPIRTFECLREAFAAADQGDAVCFVCAENSILKEVWRLLEVRTQPALKLAA